LGPEGRGFESLRPDHFDIPTHPAESNNYSKQWVYWGRVVHIVVVAPYCFALRYS